MTTNLTPAQLARINVLRQAVLRHAANFPTQNLQQYFARKAHREVERLLSHPAAATQFEGFTQKFERLAEQLRRQALVHSLYHTDEVSERR